MALRVELRWGRAEKGDGHAGAGVGETVKV